MKLVVDMNLSPEWVAVLERHGWEAVHWSNVGNPRATDSQIMAWANTTGHVVFTHDLGFGALLAAGGDQGPSVIQVRTQDVTPGHLEGLLVAALRDHEVALDEGALVSVDEARSRVRILPIKSGPHSGLEGPSEPRRQRGRRGAGAGVAPKRG